MICSRFIKPGTRHRLVIKGCSCAEMIHLNVAAIHEGYKEVTLVRFILHRLFWWRSKR